MDRQPLGGILVAGHASVDHVFTPAGSMVQPGGAAFYAAMAARVFCNEVGIVTAVGKDFDYLDLLLKEFASQDVVITRAKSSRFEIHYDDKWVSHYRVSSFGAARYLRAARIAAASSNYSHVHLAPMPPHKVRKAVDALRRKGNTTISLNSWEGYMTSEDDRKVLRRLMSDVDFFIINEREVTRLAEVDSISAALRVVDTSHLVVTLGEFGAIYVRDGRLDMTPAQAGIGGRIVDTTGAGDAWCGAFAGALSRGESVASSILAASIVSAIKCRGWNFEKIRSLRFNSVEEIVDFAVRLREGGQLTLKKYL